MYFCNLVLVMALAGEVTPQFLLHCLTQSLPLKWSIDPLVAHAKAKVFSLRILHAVFLSMPIVDFVSGVKRISTLLFLFPVILIRWSLKI